MTAPRQKTREDRRLKLEKYVGRIVRLNQQAFEELRSRARQRGEALENCFLVAEVSRGVRKLICYGAHLRIVVAVSDVAFI